MRLAFFVLLAVLGLGACAAHNSHRVELDLANDFDPLVDEAYAQLMVLWPVDEPGGSIGARVVVEPVPVRWSPKAAEADRAEPALPIEQAGIAQRVESRLHTLMGGAPDPSLAPDYVIEAELHADLHDPQTITYGLTCSLARPQQPGKVLARGNSQLVQKPRLFCHGCNEAWSGLGTRLAPPAVGAGHVGVWTGIYCPPTTSSSSTYTKIR